MGHVLRLDGSAFAEYSLPHVASLPLNRNPGVKPMNRPEHVQRFQEALRSKEPSEELYRLAVSLRDEGITQIELYELFSQFQMATSSDDPRYDAIVDTMDLIYGGPWAKGGALFPTELSEEKLNEHRK